MYPQDKVLLDYIWDKRLLNDGKPRKDANDGDGVEVLDDVLERRNGL